MEGLKEHFVKQISQRNRKGLRNVLSADEGRSLFKKIRGVKRRTKKNYLSSLFSFPPDFVLKLAKLLAFEKYPFPIGAEAPKPIITWASAPAPTGQNLNSWHSCHRKADDMESGPGRSPKLIRTFPPSQRAPNYAASLSFKGGWNHCYTVSCYTADIHFPKQPAK